MITPQNTSDLLETISEKLKTARHLVAFTGAGISVESGIPSFRGEDGLWNRYDPRILELGYFLQHPEISWPVIKEIFYTHFNLAKPNAAHKLMAALEQQGVLKTIITQNIDNLHQDAGSHEVICFHGNSSRLVCTRCAQPVSTLHPAMQLAIPCCSHCGGVLKPDFIFFGEDIPAQAYTNAFASARACDVMLVVGTTGEVYPAALLPKEAKANGAFVIEINPGTSLFSRQTADIHLPMKAGEAAMALAQKLSITLD